MVRCALIVPTLICGLSSFAQEEIGEYEMSYFNKAYNIQATEEGDFWIDCASLDALDREGGMRLKAGDVEEFRTALQAARAKYLEWSNTAKANNVTELDKEMDIKMPRMACYFGTSDLHFDFGQRFALRFKIFKDGRHGLLATTGKLQASDNQFMNMDGIALVFTDTEEVDEFMAHIDPAKAAEHFAAKKQKGELFK